MRNVIFFVYLFAGAVIYVAVVALARVDRTRCCCWRRARSPAFCPPRDLVAQPEPQRFLRAAIAATAWRSAGAGALRRWRTKRLRAVVAVALGLSGGSSRCGRSATAQTSPR